MSVVEGNMIGTIEIQDLKGITEYSEEELNDLQIKKEIKVAMTSLEMVVKKLCKNYPLLQPAIRFF